MIKPLQIQKNKRCRVSAIVTPLMKQFYNNINEIDDFAIEWQIYFNYCLKNWILMKHWEVLVTDLPDENVHGIVYTDEDEAMFAAMLDKEIDEIMEHFDLKRNYKKPNPRVKKRVVDRLTQRVKTAKNGHGVGDALNAPCLL